MSSFRELLLKLSFTILVAMYCTNVFADSHDKENSPKENKEEPLPLNDPFVGDGSLGGGTGIKVVAENEESKRNLSIFNFKLVGIVEGEDESYASIINDDEDIITLAAFEEIAPGVTLITINSKEIVFDKNGESLVAINFKNQVIERNN